MYERHGMYGTPEYSSWQEMKKRCLNKSSHAYDRYGGRGITICARWINSFPNFFSDMGLRTSRNHSLDRIDNNGNYKPSNCKWSTAGEQARNQRIYKNNKSGHKGVYKNKNEGKWKVQINSGNKRIFLGTFATIEQAIAARIQAEARYWT